jgi:hypothetical protein
VGLQGCVIVFIVCHDLSPFLKISDFVLYF